MAGCSSTAEQKSISAAEDTCGANKVMDRIGEKLDVDLFREIEMAVPHHHVRVIKPDTPVTMDYVPDRTNVKLDKQDVITEISCG
ncbi:I78 family peptidase inhibitor [Dongia soli]